MTRVFVPRDAGAVAVGADEVAAESRASRSSVGSDVEIVRNGSRGLYWLEPMVEVETPPAASPTARSQPSDVASLLDAGFLDGRRRIRCRSARPKRFRS